MLIRCERHWNQPSRYLFMFYVRPGRWAYQIDADISVLRRKYLSSRDVDHGAIGAAMTAALRI